MVAPLNHIDNMPADERRQWSAALRSGKYAQGEQYLRKGRGKSAQFCCLGVFHHAVRGVNLNALTKQPLVPISPTGKDITPILKASGIVDYWSVHFPYDEAMVPAFKLNDDELLSFEQIADLIDESLTRTGDAP